jgi:hypothetical protein
VVVCGGALGWTVEMEHLDGCCIRLVVLVVLLSEKYFIETLNEFREINGFRR